MVSMRLARLAAAIRLFRLLAFAPVVAALTLAGPTPAAAATVSASGAMVTGVVHLPIFPGTALDLAAPLCADGPIGGTYTVGGTIGGTVETDGVANPADGGNTCLGAFTLFGVTSGNPVPGSLVVNYGYTEPCATGIAVGLATGDVVKGSTGALVQYFLWNRVGLTSVILLSGTTYGGPASPGHVIGSADLLHTGGVAAGLFVPLTVPATPCPGGPLNAYVAAVGSW